MDRLYHHLATFLFNDNSDFFGYTCPQSPGTTQVQISFAFFLNLETSKLMSILNLSKKRNVKVSGYIIDRKR